MPGVRFPGAGFPTKPTKKAAQAAENAAVIEVLNSLPLDTFGRLTGRAYMDSRTFALRSCSADVWKLADGTILLRSYATFVAAITPEGVGVDFLRYVYGYTATSAQHISKFFADYRAHWFERMTWKPV